MNWLDYNTRVVLAGTMLLGVSSGVVGTYMLLRKRALVGDVASHAALPGIGVAYLTMEQMRPGSGKWLPGLLVGAACSASLGLVVSHALSRIRRIKEDAALGITLSLFFGAGVALFTLIQRLPTGQAAGLNDFIFGKAASLIASDVWGLAIAACVVVTVCALVHKELALLCFDAEYAQAAGWSVTGLDLLLTAVVIVVTVLGMQSVGLLLVVALLVLPPTSARFWTDRLGRMVAVSALLGGMSSAAGVLLSAIIPKLAAGAVIVLMGTLAFAVSVLFGTTRGIVWRWFAERDTRRRIGLHDLLRASYEVVEPRLTASDATDLPITFDELLQSRRWSAGRLRKWLARGEAAGLIRRDSSDRFHLTQMGRREAEQAVRNHRLWELYLIHYADVARTNVDRSADAIEHVLQPEIIEELERLWKSTSRDAALPANPHSELELKR